jgi:predicted PurR-regulated permease PerM
MEKKNVSVFINPWSIVMLIGILIVMYLLWTLSALVFIFFLAFVISSTLRPFVKRIHEKFKIPKPAIISTVFVIVFLIISVLSYLVVDNVSKEVRNLNVNQVVTDFLDWVNEVVPGDPSLIIDTIEGGLGQESEPESIGQKTISTSNQIFGIDNILKGGDVVFDFLGKTVGGFALAFTLIIISYYMLSREEDVFDGIIRYLPTKKQETIKRLISRIEEKLGAWLGTQLFLMIFIGLFTYLGLVIPSFFIPDDLYSIGRFALTIAVIAGILEIIPVLGPTITMVVAIILSIVTGGDHYLGQTIYIIIYFQIIQNLESIYVIPKLMKHAVGLDPIATILGFFGAFTMFGPAGAMIVVPVMATITIIMEFYKEENKELNSG